MPVDLNSLLKKHVPRLHRFLKRSLERAKLPVPKMLMGRPVWTHFQLFNHELTEPNVYRWIAQGLRPGTVFLMLAHIRAGCRCSRPGRLGVPARSCPSNRAYPVFTQGHKM